jgi:serine/threonine protein phosphatase 1
MKYAMSDIHGCYDKFIKMLELINFSEQDELYVLGDIFDRGDKPLEILDYIINHKNITLIKGNHEKMFEDYFENNDASLWIHNGGQTTLNAIIKNNFLYEEALYKYIKRLPLYKIVDKFILVHAGLYLPNNYESLKIETIMNMQEEDIMLWDRSSIGDERAIEGYTIIVGHTPAQSITKDYNNVKILHRKGVSYIDCGCVFGERANGKLACLCLDNMEEFYV